MIERLEYILDDGSAETKYFEVEHTIDEDGNTNEIKTEVSADYVLDVYESDLEQKLNIANTESQKTAILEISKENMLNMLPPIFVAENSVKDIAYQKILEIRKHKNRRLSEPFVTDVGSVVVRLFNGRESTVKYNETLQLASLNGVSDATILTHDGYITISTNELSNAITSLGNHVYDIWKEYSAYEFIVKDMIKTKTIEEIKAFTW